MKKYSTENLYLCRLAIITDIEYNNNYFLGKTRYYDVLSRNVLARKEDSVYVDIFTGTYYEDLENGYDVGSCYVYKKFPIITNAKYITESNAVEILKEANPTFFEIKEEIEQEETMAKKFMRTLTRRNNKE